MIELSDRHRLLYDAVLIAMQVAPHLTEENDWLMEEAIESPDTFPLIRIWDLTEIQDQYFQQLQLMMVRATIQKFNITLEELSHEEICQLPCHRRFDAILRGRLRRTMEGIQNE